MKKFFIFILFTLHFSLFASFAQLRMRDMFASMPDSMLAMMTKNDRLDCIDFIENNMKASVRNKLDQYVELKQLTADYLLLETSELSRVEMKMISQSDSTCLLYVVRTYCGAAADSYVECFNQDWQPVQHVCSRPSVEAFFPSLPTEQNDALQGALLSLQDLTLLQGRLSADTPTLTWKIALDELSKDEKKAAQEFVQPVMQSLLP